MKILVTAKRVTDPDSKIVIKPDGSLDLDGVEPMARASDEPARLRDDEPGEPLPGQTLADLAPQVEEFHDADGGVQRFIRVPKVLGEGGA